MTLNEKLTGELTKKELKIMIWCIIIFWPATFFPYKKFIPIPNNTSDIISLILFFIPFIVLFIMCLLKKELTKEQKFNQKLKDQNKYNIKY